MEQHAVPRQITSFEFKLVGFFTLKQFGYLVVFAGVAVLAYFITPIPIVNMVFGGGIFGLGLAFVLVKYNERSLDVWIKNIFVRLFSPSQYRYHKRNAPPAFLQDVFIYADPAIVATHLDARQKLSNYTGPAQQVSPQKQEIHDLIHETPKLPALQAPVLSNADSPLQNSTGPVDKTPVLLGMIKNNKETPLPNIMLYIKDMSGKNVRILKTNSHGVFASYHPLVGGSYSLEIRDLGSHYFFDTINLTIPQTGNSPLAIYSKEII